MRSLTSLWPVAVGVVLLTGCAPSHTAVYVNLDSPLGGAFVEERIEPPGGRPQSIESWTLQADVAPLPNLGAELDSSKKAMLHAREVLAKNRTRAVRSLYGELFRAYRKEVERQAIGEQARLAERAERVYAEADARASELLRGIAAERGEALNFLALRVDFPVPPIEAWPTISAERVWERRWRERSEQLARQLELLDAGYGDAVKALFRRAQEEVAHMKAELRLATAYKLDEASSRAIREAEEAFRDGGEVVSVLADRELVRVTPDSGVEAVFIQGGAPLEPEPRLGPSRKLDPRAALEEECRIWAAQFGYRLVGSKEQGRDATKEFWTWKSTRHLGP